MIEPRFKEALKGKTGSAQDSLKIKKWKEDMATKKTKYLRLGYTTNPRKQKGKQPPNKPKIKSECPGKKQNCLGCKGANVISPENLVKEQSGAEAIAPLFEEKPRCCGEPGDDCCCGEE